MNNTPSTRSGKQLADAAALLPSFQQFVHLAIAKAESDLEGICRIRFTDEHWSDDDFDVGTAVDCALDQVRRMKGMQFAELDAFEQEWFKVAAVLNLGSKSFSRSDCSYSRRLESACHMFSQTAEMADFITAG